ncbi:hypothetical protein QTP86_023862, partial [Hemibagrus guttatus]
VFNDCSGRTHIDFTPTGTEFHVDSDGTVTLKGQVTLHNGHKMFSVHAWDSKGKKHTALVRVEHQADHHLEQHEDVDEIISAQKESTLLLEFPKSGGLRRRKREWVIPPVRILENDRGDFPKALVQIKSSYAKETKMVYRITGVGADEPPVGLFTIDKYTGQMYVSKPLDRELKDKYELQVHVKSITDSIVEPAMEVIVEVLDMNDNNPIFTQNPFLGSVPEASKIGYEFMTVSATDADDPNSYNADIRYSIISQNPQTPNPNMFAINPISGAIQVNSAGLDREVSAQIRFFHQLCTSSLIVTRPNKQEGIITTVKALDYENNNKFTLLVAVENEVPFATPLPTSTATVIVNVLDKKRPWLIPPVQVSENEQGPFPKEIAQIKPIHAKTSEVKYSINGRGANLPPVGLFLMDKNTGKLSVSGPLDRETKDEYVLEAHIIGLRIHEIVELIILVVDQNDNKPVFTQSPFTGTVSDASEIGYPFMTISATDADDPLNTDNADIRYSIISQVPPEPKPNMFAINPISGVIQVNAKGLDFSTGMWEISPICFPENARGPFPKQLVKLKSSQAKQTKIAYRLTGEGADQAPVGLFTVDKDNGWLSVTKHLDRETKHEYVLQAHTDGDQPIEITICVIDQNDNKPVFTQDRFLGSVPAASKAGFKFLTISATDADDPKTQNSNIRYSIISQNPALPQPNMFEINPVSGEIQVKSEGFDREKYPEYILEVQAADMQGLAQICSSTTAPVHKVMSRILWKNFIALHRALTSTPVNVSFPEEQVLCGGYVDSTPCSPAFESDLFVLTVHRRHLPRGTRLGTVVFNDCDLRTRTVFETTDKRFHVESDGTVKMNRQVTLHDGHKRFSVHAWDSKGKKHTVLVRVEHQGSANHNHVQQEDVGASEPEQDEPYGRNKSVIKDVFDIINSFTNKRMDPYQKHEFIVFMHLEKEGQKESTLLLEFPKSGGLRRRKREWVIPPVRILENERGDFPKALVQIKSSYAKETKMVYRITGVGADEPPVGLFTIDKYTGQMYVSKPLDRELKDKYELQAHAKSITDSIVEPAMEVIVEVLDMNDNNPIFTQNPFLGSVPEASKIGYEFMTVSATDADDPNTDNADIRYTIVSQNPQTPNPNMFAINPISGAIRVNSAGLDREANREYTLEIQAADMKGEGRAVPGKVVITVEDSNDNAPAFSQPLYNVSVPEDKVGALVAKLPVTDGDEPQSSAWAAKFRIVNGDTGGFFNISTGPNKQEGIITTVKALDYENNNKFTLLVAVENEVPFATPLPTSTATVIVNVLDVNEAPVFEPKEKIIFKPEDVAVDGELTVYTATDPDTNKNQKITYRVGLEPAGWLKVNPDTGLISVKSPMDRESTFVKDGKYRAQILAVDDDVLPATGTGTLIIELEDVNDNAPSIEERDLRICNKDSPPRTLSVSDNDGPGNTSPFSVELQGDGRNNWTARMNDSKTGIVLSLKTQLQQGRYSVILRVYDNQRHSQDNVVEVEVCDCTGTDVQCKDLRGAAIGFPAVLGILGAVLALLLLLLLLLLFLKRKGTKKEQPLINDDDIRDNVYYYDEEGGGEDDQDYDLSVLHRGLDNRPDVFRNDVVPTFMPAPQYRPRPANPEEIGTFIDDNLKAADNDPTAPPYDSLLVFDYEGGGSEAGSLSSLNSSNSGDQDFDRVAEWGPRFKKLADMYGGGED